jgi:hypothetical protein
MTINKAIHNAQTNEITIEPMTKEEIAAMEKMHAEMADNLIQKQQLLDKLGLTTEEIAALLS